MRTAIFHRAVAIRLAVAMSCTAVLGASVAPTDDSTVQEVCRQTDANDPSGGQLLDLVGSAIRVTAWLGCVTIGPAYPGLTLYRRMLACA